MKILLVAVISLAACSASTLGLVGGSWYNIDRSSVNGDGSPYMDNPSLDGPGKSFLDLIPTATEYYGAVGDSNAAPQFVYMSSTFSEVKFTMLGKITAFMDFDSLWLHPIGQPGVRIDIFSGSDRAGATRTVQVPHLSVICISSGDGNNYCSDASTSPDGSQRFAFARGPNGLFGGADDYPATFSSERWGDFNEPLFTATGVSSVPEPGTLGLAALTLAGAAFTARRKNPNLAR